MKPSVSIIICCYNSAARLPQTLAHLARQEYDEGIAWEILVVDNGSTDGTTEVAVRECPAVIRERLRILSEPRVGKTQALLTGFQNSTKEVICIIDDDNWVNKEYIANVSHLFSENPQIGIAGGPSTPVFETPPPEWIKEISGFYAIGDQHSNEGDITKASGHLLWGAGSCIRRSAYSNLFDQGFTFQLTTTRLESKLQTGEDTELCFAIRDSGWKVWYDRRLSIQHYVPKQRMSWNYACRLFLGSGNASAYLEMYLIAFQIWPFDSKNKIKSSWAYQFIKSCKNLFVSFVRNPYLCLSCAEGEIAVLHYKSQLKKTLTMLALRNSYTDNINRIRNAKWNKVNK